MHPKTIDQFQNKVLLYYTNNGRNLPWRKTNNPYHILVSEIMLQQTQVDRVIPKYKTFIQTFPNFKKLAHASLRDVLKTWSGLGYNRRAKFLHETAKKVRSEFHGKLPSEPEVLKTFPGIGKNTAGSIAAFAFNKPTTFIETNIRAVIIHHFFKNSEDVRDADVLSLVQQTLYTNNPRLWYNALMDYGTHIKATHPNPSRKSKHHTVQKQFKGSNREIRGVLLKILAEKSLNQESILNTLPFENERIANNLEKLVREGMIQYEKGRYHLG